MYKICNRCVMDSSAFDISFDKNGNCNFCNDFLEKSLFYEDLVSEIKLKYFIKKIKKHQKNTKYDCLVGISGGVDSAWALKKVVELGLKPLAVHFDNGWNTNMSQENIYNLLTKLNVDLITYVVDWEEYKDVMTSFFKANVVDIELIYDNALMKVNYSTAKKYNIKYILAGTNRSTEGMRMPKNWNWFKYDKKNIYFLHKKFGNTKIKSLPTIGTFEYIYYGIINGIKWINFLDYFNYDKKLAMEELNSFCDFKKYDGKHSESIFTRFYQGFILPKKFKIDKRKVHLSNLVITEQLSREEALRILKLNPYDSEIEFLRDKKYFLKKMNFSERFFNQYIETKNISHDAYNSEKKLWLSLEYLYKKFIKQTQ